MSKRPFTNQCNRSFDLREKFRVELFKRQDGLCHLCEKPMTLQRGRGSKVGKLFATFDHVLPRARGGTAYYTNLKLAHRACNNARNDRPAVPQEADRGR